MAYKMRRRAMGLQVQVSDSNKMSPLLQRPIGGATGPKTDRDAVKSIWLIRSILEMPRPARPCFLASAGREVRIPQNIAHACLLATLIYGVCFCRHGESEHNTSSDWGIRDPGLTEKGWKQVFAWQESLRCVRSLEPDLISHVGLCRRGCPCRCYSNVACQTCLAHPDTPPLSGRRRHSSTSRCSRVF